jgi:prepilin-type N-terminal cleavage/methylation domain-containing protein
MRKRAFTLLEILVVVSVIGLLASLILPALGSAREKALFTTDMSNLRQIGIASELYRESAPEGTIPDLHELVVMKHLPAPLVKQKCDLTQNGIANRPAHFKGNLIGRTKISFLAVNQGSGEKAVQRLSETKGYGWLVTSCSPMHPIGENDVDGEPRRYSRLALDGSVHNRSFRHRVLPGQLGSPGGGFGYGMYDLFTDEVEAMDQWSINLRKD